jgi:hypothetical protein
VGGDDAIVEDVVDVGLGGEAAEGGVVVFRRGRLDGSDADVFVATAETGSGGCDAGFGIAGDGGIAIENEVSVRSDAGGVDLRGGEGWE